MGSIKRIKFGESKYVAKEVVGKGQFGTVYLGIGRKKKTPNGKKIPKKVAIKEYYFSRFYDPSTQTNKADEYFKREIQATKIQEQFPGSQLHLIEFGKQVEKNNNLYYIILNFVDGKTIKEWFVDAFGTSPKLDEDQIHQLTHDIIIPIARHLNYCHSQGLVHRDLSLDNILIKEPKKNSAVPVIIDWGAAKIRNAQTIQKAPKNYLKNQQVAATAFINNGTPPEIISGLAPLAASDIYMLGHIMYFLFTGGLSAKSPTIKDDYILKPKMENPDLDETYNSLVMKSTQYEPADRIQNMVEILHVLEKAQENFNPSQITYLEKLDPLNQLGPGFSSNNLQSAGQQQSYTPRSNTNSSSQATPDQVIKSPTGDSNFSEKFPKPQHIPNQSNSPSPAYGPIFDDHRDNSIDFNPNNKAPTYFDEWKQKDLSSSQINSEKSLEDKPAPLSVPQLPKLPKLEQLTVDERTQSFAKGFLTYFKDPKWQYKRQDYVQYYWELFSGIKKAYDNKKFLFHQIKIPKNLYIVGNTMGSINDVVKIIDYFEKVIIKEPNSLIVFLGNYFSKNHHDIESFTMILSLKSIYPNNVVLLRGSMEIRESMEKDGLLSHAKFKFGGYYSHIYDLILSIISRLNLAFVCELSGVARAILLGGGIPFNPKKPSTPCFLNNLILSHKTYHATLSKMDIISQTIVNGTPNELSNSSGQNPNGIYLFSWQQLQDFLYQNSLHYVFLPSLEKYGHRTLWNKISLLNSTSIVSNKPGYISKIILLNVSGTTEIDVNKLV